MPEKKSLKSSTKKSAAKKPGALGTHKTAKSPSASTKATKSAKAARSITVGATKKELQPAPFANATPESLERKKRITLKAFRIAYDNYHRRENL